MSNGRVLLVDDDPDILDYLGSFLFDNGYTVESAESVALAEELLESGRFEPDIVLLDALMPGRSGLDLLVRLRQDERWCDLPLVIVTGSDQVLEDVCSSYLGPYDGVDGPDGLLGKPIDRETLLAVVSKLVREATSRLE